MDPALVEHRRNLALMQHARVIEEAEFVAMLTRQAHNRAVAQPVFAAPSTQPSSVRQRIDTNMSVLR